MCGLAGMITHKNAKLTKTQLAQRNNIFQSILFAMSERGTDATGMLAVCENKHCIYKKAIDSFNFLKENKFKQIMAKNPSIVIGHTRYGTVGAKDEDKNAHPFEYGNIIGAHNGSVTNYHDSPIWKDSSVDSEAIFHALNEFDNDYEATFPTLEGAFAITWVDKREPDTVYLVRENNPLYILEVPALKTKFWASIDDVMLVALFGALGGSVEFTQFELKSNFVYRINTQFKIEKKKVEFKKSEPFTGTTYNNWRKEGISVVEYDPSKDDLEDSEIVTGEVFTMSDDEIKAIMEEGAEPVTMTEYYGLNKKQVLGMYEQLITDGCAECGHNLITNKEMYWSRSINCMVCDDCASEDKLIEDGYENIMLKTRQVYALAKENGIKYEDIIGTRAKLLPTVN